MTSQEFNQRLHHARYLFQQRQHTEALKVYEQLVREFPGLANLLDEYGRSAAAAGEHELAVQLWDRLLKQESKSVALLLHVAGEHAKIRHFEKARALSREAVGLEPGNLAVQINLASLLTLGGDMQEAQEAVQRCLKLDPYNEQTRYFAAHLQRRQNKLAEAEQQFRDLLASGLRDPNAIYYCHLELARVLDKTEQYDEAMAQLKVAKALAAKTLNLNDARKEFDEWRERMPRKAKSLPKNILTTWGKSFPPGARTSAPPLAFLGGHPRSGTTLLERILDSHPSIAACDECLALMTSGWLIDILQPEIPADTLNFVRQRYVKNFLLSLGAPDGGGMLLDKNPAFTSSLPAFLRAFPELRVLIALRDPRDVLVSSYFESLVKFSHLSFENLAEHYRAIMDVWLTVREWEGFAWMETRYEDIVADLEREGGRVTRFLGLEWHENQAHYHEQNRQKTIVSTSNYTNVGKPVYAKSMGRWQVYEKYMGPVLPVLEPYCQKFGYG